MKKNIKLTIGAIVCLIIILLYVNGLLGKILSWVLVAIVFLFSVPDWPFDETPKKTK